ncbi:MAG: hypothetical protein MK008_01480 [Bdellovibrionales bacterium]|nr:hypothetical protein [Bdellovibrionales bacterium]
MFKIILIVLFSLPTFALNLEKDVLEKSQNLILQKDRLKAVSLIKNVINSDNLSKKQTTQALEALGVYSRIFLEEKTQLIFEHGLSLINSDLEKSIQKIQEAKQLEPLNLSVGLALSKALLLKKQCKDSYSNLESYAKIYEMDSELLELMEISLLCRLEKALLLEFLETFEKVKQAEQKKQRLLEEEAEIKPKSLNLEWIYWVLSLQAENLSRKDHEFLIQKYQKECPKKALAKEDQLKPWLFCGKQEEFQSFFAKKFKIEEKTEK